jgi:hypothetical protein
MTSDSTAFEKKKEAVIDPCPVERVRSFLRSEGFPDEVMTSEETIFTVDDAARVVGAPSEQILKSLVLLVDGNGNRVSGMAWGNNTLIFVVGMNKLTATIDEAISRTRNTATPPNALRLKLDTPCTKTGYCVDCSSPDRVCKALLILERATGGRKSHVILVGEDLGF